MSPRETIHCAHLIAHHCVWIVYQHNYEQSGIDSVWTTEEAAIERLRECDNVNPNEWAPSHDVQRWTTDVVYGYDYDSGTIKAGDVRTPEEKARREQLRAERNRGRVVVTSNVPLSSVTWSDKPPIPPPPPPNHAETLSRGPSPRPLRPLPTAGESNMTEEHPFTKPDGSDASMFIQWKGTDVCMDFSCPCGHFGHFDGGFAYAVRCPACGAVYEMGTQVIAKRRDDFTGHIVDIE